MGPGVVATQFAARDQGLQRIEAAVEQECAAHSKIVKEKTHARGEFELAIVVDDHGAFGGDAQRAK